jgi:hypothetical protein
MAMALAMKDSSDGCASELVAASAIVARKVSVGVLIRQTPFDEAPAYCVGRSA